MCLDEHPLGMSNAGLYLFSSLRKIPALSTYSAYSHHHSLHSTLPVVSCGYFVAESGDSRGKKRNNVITATVGGGTRTWELP